MTDRTDPMTAGPAPLQFGEWLRRVRRSRGETQADASRRFGVSQPSYFRWESGESRPKPLQLAPLAEYLATDMATLVRVLYGVAPPR